MHNCLTPPRPPPSALEAHWTDDCADARWPNASAAHLDNPRQHLCCTHELCFWQGFCIRDTKRAGRCPRTVLKKGWILRPVSPLWGGGPHGARRPLAHAALGRTSFGGRARPVPRDGLLRLAADASPRGHLPHDPMPRPSRPASASRALPGRRTNPGGGPWQLLPASEGKDTGSERRLVCTGLVAYAIPACGR